MFRDQDLINHLQSKNSITVDSLIIAELNQNILTNIEDYGNYRWRPTSASSSYQQLKDVYDSNDVGNFYANALESSNISKYRTEDPNEPLIFEDPETERQLYYSLKECFNPFRPRSGINKILFFNGNYVDSVRSGRRPRYYFSSRKDQFKYWTSYRKENGLEYGVSSTSPISGSVSAGYRIEDASPFVIYDEEVATNRIVVKMQTNLSDPDVTGIDGTELVGNQIRVRNTLISDPLKDVLKSTIPKRWKIQYLDAENNWNDAIEFDQNSVRKDGSRIVPWDGHVEILYDVKIPEEYREDFNFIDFLSASTQLPLNVVNGQSYIVGSSESSPGELYIWDTATQQWVHNVAEYGFSLVEDNDTKRLGIVNKIVNPDRFIIDANTTYREFIFIKGIRVVVETMYGPNKTFDLIEMSPRLKINITDQIISFDIVKNIAATDYGLPVGGLVASTGKINISNHNGAFTELNVFDKDTNLGSIISDNLRPQIKFDFYETVFDVNGYDKFVPLKTLYSENSAFATSGMNDVEISLRDAFFRLESAEAPPLLVRDCTLTMAVATMLDNIGFSNYIFKGISNANDPVIPFFFVEPNISVAEVLQRLAQATQTAMFFDEFNNFVIMPKEYLMPDIDILDTDVSISERLITLYGQKSGSVVPNIEEISNADTKIINNGKINYVTRYVQREIRNLEQAQLSDPRDRKYGYKTSILWELGEQEGLRTINQPTSNTGYALGAVALNSSLGSVVPYVENGEVKENIIDVGADSVIWLPRFYGYLYANGEIIRYDAQEYTVSGVGNVWINNNNEYQKYFSKLPFNGQMWLTGRLRIFSEPYYEESQNSQVPGLQPGVILKNGQVKSHGRGQFGTQVVSHFAGINPQWKDSNIKKSFRMDSRYIFSTTPAELIEYPNLGSALTTSIGNDDLSKGKIEVTDKIVNFLRKTVRSESNLSTSSQSEATVQASALILSGPQTFLPAPVGLESTSPKDVVSYVYKDLSNDYKHVGTRMRIIGKVNPDNSRSPLNATSYFTTTGTSGQSSEISGSSGGIGYMVDKNTNSGYYFEIAALSEDILSYFGNSASVSGNFSAANEVLHNVIFYKVLNKTTSTPDSGKTNIAVPVKLWGTTADILVDAGQFVGMDRLASQNKPTVYDLGIEHEVVGTSVKFYLYINNALVATVIDNAPLPSISSNSSFTMCLFTRASSKCMFENIYALKNRSSQTNSITMSSQTSQSSSNSIISMTSNNQVSIAEALRKYALSGIVQSTYLSSISSEKPPGFDIYFEEFGTILRECAYFNIKYDQAYPALIARLLELQTTEKSYVVSGFIPGSYGAEFLVFNSTDRAINLSEISSNRLMIYGVTFTQNISNVLTVDDYFRQISNLSEPSVISNNPLSPTSIQKIYDDIKISRSIYGEKSFSLDSVYIQDEDSANSLMSWIINKTVRPRKVFEISAFGVPHIQLGDIVKINYDLPEGVKIVDEDKRFVVISATYSRSSSNIVSQLRLLEV